MSTIIDIAREAGCSLSTVTRALNNKDDVSPQTRARVLAVAERLSYAPHGPARSLVTGRTRTIGQIVTNPAYPINAVLVEAVERAVSSQDYGVLLANNHEDCRQEERALRMLRERAVDGILLTSAQVDVEEPRGLSERKTPVVLVNRDIEKLGLDFVGCDYFGGAFAATSHLIRLGHRHIAFLGEPPRLSPDPAPAPTRARSRFGGYLHALTEYGVGRNDGLIRRELRSIVDIAGAYAITKDLLRRRQPFTALFAVSSLVIHGVQQALREAGLRVPDDVALAAYGDYDFAPYFEVPLTCVRHPVEEMGRRAAELLLRRIAGESPAQPEKIVLPTELVVRRSCGASAPLPVEIH